MMQANIPIIKPSYFSLLLDGLITNPEPICVISSQGDVGIPKLEHHITRLIYSLNLVAVGMYMRYETWGPF